MKKENKFELVSELKEKFSNATNFYITDSSSLTVARINELRRICFEKGVEIKVVKNTLAQKAMEQLAEEKNFEGLYEALKGPTTLMFSEVGKEPAKIIKDFRGKETKPLLKAAYIDQSIFLGDDQLEALIKLKSKEELLGEVITLLQSPAKNVISALKSGGSTIAGLLKTLEDRAQ
jgi:large subunit ribosomal protein L10